MPDQGTSMTPDQGISMTPDQGISMTPDQGTSMMADDGPMMADPDTGTTPDGGQTAQPGDPCQTSDDCGNLDCLYWNAGCNSVGTCGNINRCIPDAVVQWFCGCDGRSFVLRQCLTEPWAHRGPCAGDTDGGVAFDT